MVRLKKTIGFIALALVAAVLIAGCKSSSSGGNPTPPPSYKITIAPADLGNLVLERFNKTFVATCTNQNGVVSTCTTDTGVTWSVTGNMTATATKGIFLAGNVNGGITARVTASYAGVSASYDVVILKIVRTEILPGSLSIMMGSSQAFTAICHSAEGLSATCTDKVTWAADTGMELTTPPSTFLANGDALSSNIYAYPLKSTFDIANACTSLGACAIPILSISDITIGSGEVIAIKITPELGLVQGEQKWFNVLCYTKGGGAYDCTHSPYVTFDGGGDMIPCNPLITDAPFNNCWQMDYLGDFHATSGLCTQTNCPTDLPPLPIQPQQNSYVQATYVNPVEYGGLVYNDQAELHCRYMCHGELQAAGIPELEATKVGVSCYYTDFFNDDCSKRWLNYIDEVTPLTPFIEWDVSLGVPDYATASISQNELTLTAIHIPGPCGAAVEVIAEYFDDDDFTVSVPPGNLLPKPYLIGGDTPLPIINDDDLVVLKDLVWDPTVMDTVDYYDATCGYDFAGTGTADPEAEYSCYDVYVHEIASLNPVAFAKGYYPLGYFINDPLSAYYCIDAFDADWTWHFPVDDCNPAFIGWPPNVRLPQPDPGAWTAMFAGGICGMAPPENRAYANYAYYTDENNAPTLISGLASADVTLDFIDHTRPDWVTTTTTIEINGGFYVNDPIWDHTPASVNRPAIHPMKAGVGGNWVSFYTQVGTCDIDNPLNKCDQVVRVRCQDLETGAWSQCVNNRITLVPLASWLTLPNSEWDFIVLADPANYLMKDDAAGAYMNAPLTLAAGWGNFMLGFPNRPLNDLGTHYSFNDIVLRPDAVPPGGPGTCDTVNFMTIMVTHNPWYVSVLSPTFFESIPGTFAFIQLCELL